MATDERRREVAENLRYCADMCHNIGVLDSDVLNALGVHCGDTDGVSSAYDVEQLADLIDRPIAQFDFNEDTYPNCVCSNCGQDYSEPQAYDSDGYRIHFRYCPNCGAEVLDK